MTVSLGRWNDDRLDDLAAQVRRNAAMIEDLGALRTKLDNVGEDAHECILEVRQLKESLEKQAKVQHSERRADFRWMIGTCIATASLIIAALAVFLH